MGSDVVTSTAPEVDATSASSLKTGILFVLSGPSGVGKDKAILTLKQRPGFCLHHVITVTTRPIRPGEVHGRDYFFIDRDEFARMERDGELLEWALVHEEYYGTPIAQVRDNLARGTDVLLKIDVQGAAKVKLRVPDAVFIFLAPPSLGILEARLRERKTESPAKMALRIANAAWEMDAMSSYDYAVVNYQNHIDDAVDKIDAIIQAERCRVKRRRIDLS